MKLSFQDLLVGLMLALTLMTILTISAAAQTHEDMIRTVREASNKALKMLDEESNFNYLTDDILITTGAGTLLSGKEELKAYIEIATDDHPMYWVRTPVEIIVNEVRGLAWETGTWKGYSAEDQDGVNPVVQGKYSAQWTYISDEWKIKSQLFVTLE